MALTQHRPSSMWEEMDFWSPFESMNMMWPSMRGFSNVQNDLLAQMSPFNRSSLRCDLVERPDHYEIKADVPGFRREEIHVDVNDGCLQLKAEHSETIEGKSSDSEEASGTKWHRVERRAGTLYRSFKLPPAADLDHVAARCENGLLTINVPKKPGKPSDRPKSIPIA